MKKLILAGLIFLHGCSWEDIYIPEVNKLREIESTKYDFTANDCIDKSIQYSRHLRKKGIKHRVVGGLTSYGRHAWVEVFKNNKLYYIDPTFRDNKDGLLIIISNADKVYIGDEKLTNHKNYKMKLLWRDFKRDGKCWNGKNYSECKK